MGLLKRANQTAKKVDKKKQEDLEERAKQFHADYKELTLKYQVDIMATLNYGNNGIIPQLKMVDLKDLPAQNKPA